MEFKILYIEKHILPCVQISSSKGKTKTKAKDYMVSANQIPPPPQKKEKRRKTAFVFW